MLRQGLRLAVSFTLVNELGNVGFVHWDIEGILKTV
jgi:hypothetical protein